MGAALSVLDLIAPLVMLAMAGYLIWGDGRRVDILIFLGGAGWIAASVFAFSHSIGAVHGPGPWLPDEKGVLAAADIVYASRQARDDTLLSDGTKLGTWHTAHAQFIALIAPANGSYLRPDRVRFALSAAAILLLAISAVLLRPLCGTAASIVFLLIPWHGVWGATLLRDTLHLSVLVFSLRFAVEPSDTAEDRARNLFVVLLSLYYLSTWRIYSAGFLAIALLFTPKHRADRQYTIKEIGVIAACLLVIWPLILPMLRAAIDVMPQAWSRGVIEVGKDMMLAPVRLLLGPYPWVFHHPASFYESLYPGQWLAILALWPLALAGRRARTDPNDVDHLVDTVVIGTATVLCLVYAGNAPRQWYPAATIYLANYAPRGFTALRARNKRASSTVVGWFAIVGLAILLHLASLRG